MGSKFWMKALIVVVTAGTLSACNFAKIQFEAVMNFSNSSISNDGRTKVIAQNRQAEMTNLMDQAISAYNNRIMTTNDKAQRAIAKVDDDLTFRNQRVAVVTLKLENLDGSLIKGLVPEFETVGEGVFGTSDHKCSVSDSEGISKCIFVATVAGEKLVKIKRINIPGDDTDVSTKAHEVSDYALEHPVIFYNDEVEGVGMNLGGVTSVGDGSLGSITVVMNLNAMGSANNTSDVGSDLQLFINANASQGGF